ncbi:PH domain-containing protein [Lysobacter hankyongensis]|uniref:Bacterial Pleckstrin homology domain-containing protein n=1 Tax=Lysobacter hankyongensis TaxID=1176535 RepID=A0ABP9AHU5_9GAMM
MRREFAVPPPDLRWLILMPALGLIAGLVGIAFGAREEPRLWLMAIPMTLAVLLMSLLVRRRRVALEDDRLQIAGSMHGRTVRVAELDLAAARIVDLAEATALRPRFKTFGTSMPGFHAGHFRLRDRSQAFVLITGRSKVLMLPERGGRRLLLSLEKPQALLDALKAVTGDGGRR